MKASALRELSIDELRSKSSELRSELFNVRVKHATGQLEDTARLKSLRRDIARVETVLQSRQGAH
jgi:large subunit ribosomal protein L29